MSLSLATSILVSSQLKRNYPLYYHHPRKLIATDYNRIEHRELSILSTVLVLCHSRPTTRTAKANSTADYVPCFVCSVSLTDACPFCMKFWQSKKISDHKLLNFVPLPFIKNKINKKKVVEKSDKPKYGSLFFSLPHWRGAQMGAFPIKIYIYNTLYIPYIYDICLFAILYMILFVHVMIIINHFCKHKSQKFVRTNFLIEQTKRIFLVFFLNMMMMKITMMMMMGWCTYYLMGMMMMWWFWLVYVTGCRRLRPIWNLKRNCDCCGANVGLDLGSDMESGLDRISGMQLIAGLIIIGPLDPMDLAPGTGSSPRNIYQFLFLFSLSFLFLFLSFKLHTLPHTHTTHLMCSSVSCNVNNNNHAPQLRQPTTKYSILLANLRFPRNIFDDCASANKSHRNAIATATATATATPAAPTLLPLQSPSTATTPSSSSDLRLWSDLRPDPIDRLLEQTAKPVIQDDADGHLIYHTGDILHHRCSWQFFVFNFSIFMFRKQSEQSEIPHSDDKNPKNNQKARHYTLLPLVTLLKFKLFPSFPYYFLIVIYSETQIASRAFQKLRYVLRPRKKE